MFSEALAYLYTQLIYCHPFREGNGRTIREFVKQFSKNKGKKLGFNCELDWSIKSIINKEELNKNIEIAHLFPSLTANHFYNALTHNMSLNTNNSQKK